LTLKLPTSEQVSSIRTRALTTLSWVLRDTPEKKLQIVSWQQQELREMDYTLETVQTSQSQNGEKLNSFRRLATRSIQRLVLRRLTTLQEFLET